MKQNGYIGKILLFVVVLSTASFAFSQNHFISTYSNMGIGEMKNTTNKRYESMGGLGIGVRSNTSITPMNPASFGSIDTTSFMFDIGAHYSIYNIKSETNKTFASQGNLDYFYLGFPIAKWMKASVGFYPISSVGYNVISSDDDQTWGKINHLYEGDGGLNSYYAGFAFNFAKMFSVGANISYIGGTLKKSQSIQFLDSLNVFDSQIRNQTSIGNIWVNFGAQFYKTLKNNDKITIGFTYTPQMNLRAKSELLFRTLTYEVNGGLVEKIRDTVYNNTKKDSKLVMPTRIGLGFSYERTNFFTVGLDLEWTEWSKYNLNGLQGDLHNAFRLSAGFEIIPDWRSPRGYWKHMMYRIGFHANQTSLILQQQRIMEYGGSFGLGFPIRKSGTSINLGLEAGSKGSPKKQLVQETYFKLSLGLVISEKWFEKKRIN